MFQKFNFDTEWAVRLISKITDDEDVPIEGDAIVRQVIFYGLPMMNYFTLSFFNQLVPLQLLSLQINAEKYFFGIRKSLVEFDEVLEV